jgi:CheY-like chemotaxis protein
LNNLVSNALKFTPPGGTIEVTVAREAGHARIAVRDSGKGIEPSQLPHVFKWLHQGYDAKTTREGLGLGLFIVRRLVELDGGTVRADSEGPGRGATFTVVLPCCDAALVSAPSSAILPELGELDGLHVLVVEDELDAVELLSSVLSTRGARVTSARAGTAALSLALAAPPDVIVTDLGLPDMDGFELVRRIRAVHGGSVGIVALTGFAANDAACGSSTGFDERLTKPVDIPRLIEAVEGAARRARLRSSG